VTALDLWYALFVANAIFYVAFVVRRGEASLGFSVLLAVVLGPLVWFVWLARRAGVRRAERSSR
jgi:hypothetical protein